jgi:serine/threonine protein phosphatase 1
MDRGKNSEFSVFVSQWEPLPKPLSADTAICAVGDIHGQLSHLSSLIEWLRANVLSRPVRARHLVLLGDYIDSRSDSLGVLSYLGALDLPGVYITKLLGNHDRYLETFLLDPDCNYDVIAASGM